MDDIVERLMTQARVGLLGLPDDFDTVSYRQAADAITALRAERDAAYRKGAEDMRELAAEWHEAKVAEYTDQFAANDAYLALIGRHSSESRANEYCDDIRSGHRRSAAAIRKLEAKP